jgi:hypothetical protein
MAFPKYDYAQELITPQDLGVTRGGRFNQIGSAIAGVNYYFDAIGFGDPTGFAKLWGGQYRNAQKPLGLRFFAKTGLTCPNGEPMYQYVSTMPKGDALGTRMQKEIEGIGLPPMKGLGPGMVEDAKDAFNPARLFKVGEIQCKKLRAPVGDGNGRLASTKDPTQVWIEGPTQRDAQGMPTQEFWVEGFANKRSTCAWSAGLILAVLGIAILSHKAK